MLFLLFLFILSVYFCRVTLTSPATLTPVRVLTSLHAPAACERARLSVRLPARGPWGTPLPRWPPRPSRTTASLGGHPSQGPRQQPAVVGAAPGHLSGAVPCLPGSTKPHAPRPEGKKDGGPQGGECCSAGALPLAEGLAEKWGPYILGSSGDLLPLNGTRPARLWGCSMLGGGAGWASVWCL